MDAPLGEWIGATVHRDGGVFGAKPYSLPTGFQGYLMDQARKVVTANKSIPSDQRVRIDAKMMSDVKATAHSGSFEARSLQT
jgi:hypothetical protein